jgi:hypothetical protein
MTSRDSGSTTVNFPSGDFSAFPAGVLVGAEVLDELLADDDAVPPPPDLLHPATVPPIATARTAHTAIQIRLFTMQTS